MSKKPNFIFYFSDQQRFDTIEKDITPNIYKMIDSGDAVNFENAFTCQPVCGPARACLQTGKYASENGCYINGIALKENEVTIAKLLNENGYQTAYVGKWHLASNGLKRDLQTKAIPENFRGGYKDYWRAADCLEFTSNGYGGFIFDNDNNKVCFNEPRADAINNFALDFLNTRDKNSPFFLFVSQLEPHHQNSTDVYECAPKYKGKFKNKVIPSDLTSLNGNYKDRFHDYLSCCHSLDENFGKLIEKVKLLNEWDNTVIIYTSDHGCHFRTRNKEYKRSCHDASIKIPMIVGGGYFKKYLSSLPGNISLNKTIDNLISLIDIPSMILDFANVKIPQNFDGFTLKELLNVDSKRKNIFAQISESQLGRVVRTNDFTYSVSRPFDIGISKSRSKFYVEQFLYDNISDPCQLNNLIKDSKYKSIKTQLRKILKAEILKYEGITSTIFKRGE